MGYKYCIDGGLHDCSRDKFGGLCPYADITLLLHRLVQNYNSVPELTTVRLSVSAESRSMFVVVNGTFSYIMLLYEYINLQNI